MSHKQEDMIPWYRQFWPWFLMALPASVVVAGIGMVILAVRTPLSLVEDDYYKEGLAINQNLSSRAYARSLELQADIRIWSGQLQIDLNQSGMEQLRLRLVHSTDAALDRDLVLEPLGERRFATDLNDSLDGHYYLTLQGMESDRQWLLTSGSTVRFSGQSSGAPWEFRLNPGQ
jgi:hypothetical protein